MMTAFIIAVRGTVAQAALLGLAATVSHTAVVWVVALLGLHFASRYDAAFAEPYFQVASAVLILAIASWMLWRTWRQQRSLRVAAQQHRHDDGDHHSHRDAHLLAHAEEPVDESLSSSLFRSTCPVTGQPDYADVFIRYRGPRIDRAGLLRYLVSFRRHAAFHEACVERIFVDIANRCRPERLSVYARFMRRGGIDINPFRSNFEHASPDNIRTQRQ